MRDYPQLHDLGLDPEADRTGDLRSTKKALDRCANTVEGKSESPNTQLRGIP